MPYNLTESQKNLIRWVVERVRSGDLDEEFHVVWMARGPAILGFSGDLPSITGNMLDALADAGLLRSTPRFRTMTSTIGRTHPRVRTQEIEESRWCSLTGKAYEAVDSDFSAPDTSFLKQLTPLADVTNLDNDLKTRCLPILGAGSADPKLWDSAVRTAGVILEERLRDVGRIIDTSRAGRDLVNDVFGKSGTLASKFPSDSERQGHRDLYAGVVGAFRNPSAHRLLDPSPEDGGAFIVFVNLLLKWLEDLR